MYEQSGELKKMLINVYQDAEFSTKVGQLNVLMNPESYQMNYKIEYDEKQGDGSSGKQVKFKGIKPKDLSFEFLFDSTGIIDGKPRDDIWNEVTEFKKMLVDYDGDVHQPRHFELIWGKMLFKGRLTELNFTFKLFKPDGTPLRALAKASFIETIDDQKRVAKDKPRSPDLTHERVVNGGDHLSLMTYKIYEDPRYYFQVARANGLTGFRNLKAGDRLFFPPVDKD